MQKYLSRKFLLSAAAFLAAFFGGVAGVFPPEWCAVGMALSAGIYAACEAHVDGKSAAASQTVVTQTETKTVSATSTDRETVKQAIAPGADKEGE